jgi:predicted DCC family thiol-disulfide oxidoreductase YuxK
MDPDGLDAEERPIVIFDGDCNLCNGFVDFIIRRDRDARFLFTANQAEAGRKILDDAGVNLGERETVFLYDDGQLSGHSAAVLKIAAQLPWPYRAAVAGWVVPRVVRDWLYDFVARNRFKWFGKRDECRLPTAEEAACFLK